MKQGDQLYRLEDGDSPYSSGNTLLVATLATLGAQFDDTQPYQEFREIGTDGQPRRRVMWLLKAKTLQGEDVKTLVKRWRDPAWLRANPDSDLATAKVALENYRQLVDTIKRAVPVSIVRRGRRMAIIPENAPAARRAELLGLLDR